MSNDSEENSTVSLEIKKQLLAFYQQSLNIIRARKYNFQVEVEVENSAGNSLAEASLPEVEKQVDFIRDNVALLMTMRNNFVTLKQNLIYNLYCSEADKKALREIITDVSVLCQMILSQLKPDDEKKMYDLHIKFSRCMERYQEYVDKQRGIIKEKQGKDSEILRRIQKSERTVRKLNMTRIIKNLLFGAFMSGHSEHPEFNSFRSSLTRDLTLEDFKETWDIGYEDSITS